MVGVNKHIFDLREDFIKGILSESSLLSQPHLQFEQWLDEAIQTKVNEAHAFNLATVNIENKPSARIVYLREFFENDFYFYTNYTSRKGQDININPHVCATFFWPELERQVRIEGTVKFAPIEKSDAYFKARPIDSKIGAWSSPQSKKIAGRETLDELMKATKEKFTDGEIQRPNFWGGYVITANYYEFWQGRKSRLHDRIAYTLNHSNWKIERLAP